MLLFCRAKGFSFTNQYHTLHISPTAIFAHFLSFRIKKPIHPLTYKIKQQIYIYLKYSKVYLKFLLFSIKVNKWLLEQQIYILELFLKDDVKLWHQSYRELSLKTLDSTYLNDNVKDMRCTAAELIPFFSLTSTFKVGFKYNSHFNIQSVTWICTGVFLLSFKRINSISISPLFLFSTTPSTSFLTEVYGRKSFVNQSPQIMESTSF